MRPLPFSQVALLGTVCATFGFHNTFAAAVFLSVAGVNEFLRAASASPGAEQAPAVVRDDGQSRQVTLPAKTGYSTTADEDA